MFKLVSIQLFYSERLKENKNEGDTRSTEKSKALPNKLCGNNNCCPQLSEGFQVKMKLYSSELLNSEG